MCESRVRPQQTETKARRRAWRTTTSFKTEVIRSVDVWQDLTKEDVHCSHLVHPGAQVSETAAVPADEEGRDYSVEEEARAPRERPDPEKPTARERLEHNITHYPYRSRCRHCARGRVASRPHQRMSEEDPEFSKGRVPTISLDHCFLGSEDAGPHGAAVPALDKPLLVMYDADSEAIYCLPVASKEVTDFVV